MITLFVYVVLVGVCYQVNCLSSTDKRSNFIAAALWPLTAAVGVFFTALFALAFVGVGIALPLYVVARVMHQLVSGLLGTLRGRW